MANSNRTDATNHYFDADGYFIGSTGAYSWAICPPDAIRVAPPGSIPADKWPRLNAARDGWDLVDDHFGADAWLDGESRRIDYHGPLRPGWSLKPPSTPPDTRTSEEKRRDAYMIEADPLFHMAQFYLAEAEGQRLLDDVAKAAEAEVKAREYFRQYAEKKEEIRALYPDIAGKSE